MFTRREFVAAAAGTATTARRRSTFVLSKDIRERADPLAWYPLAAGNRWTYDCEEKTGNPDTPLIKRWRRDVTVTRVLRTDDGAVVFRQVVDTPASDEIGRSSVHYLIRGNYIYEIGDEVVDANSGALTREFRERLQAGDIEPVFFFPMREGILWSDRKREDRGQPESIDYFWHVAGRGGQGRAVRMPVKKSAYYLVYQTVGGPYERWFEKGVGIVAEWDRHNGTYWEHRTVLRDFRRVANQR